MTVSAEAEVMTVASCAKVLGVTSNTAYDYIARGLIPHIRLRGRIIIPRARFEAWLAGETVQPEEVPAGR